MRQFLFRLILLNGFNLALNKTDQSMTTNQEIDAFLKQLSEALYHETDVSQVTITNRQELIGYNISIRYERVDSLTSYDLKFDILANAIKNGEQASLMMDIIRQIRRSYHAYLKAIEGGE